MFRNSAPYISMHRGSVMVLHIPGDIMGTVAFERTLDDVALMSLLGVKICIVCGVAAQVCVYALVSCSVAFSPLLLPALDHEHGAWLMPPHSHARVHVPR
jgi:hypothetical protein